MRALIVMGLLMAAAPAAAQSDPFRSASPPVAPAAAAPRPVPAPSTPPPPPQPVSQNWEGTTSIWHIRAIVTGTQITGHIECYRRGEWSGWGPAFKGTIDAAGTVDALTTEAKSGWADRKIGGTFPTLTITVVHPDTKLSCPNGQTQLQKQP